MPLPFDSRKTPCPRVHGKSGTENAYVGTNNKERIIRTFFFSTAARLVASIMKISGGSHSQTKWTNKNKLILMDFSLPLLAKFRPPIKIKKSTREFAAFYFSSRDRTIKINFIVIIGNRIKHAALAAPSGKKHNARV